MRTIAVIVNSRIQGNPNCHLLKLLESIEKYSDNKDQVEVLVKFDTCDRDVANMVKILSTIPLEIKWIIEPRGRGYIDIHHGYNRLLQHISPSVRIIGAMGDDFYVHQGWDTALVDEARISHSHEISPEYFIIHQRPHPPSTRPDYAKTPFALNYPMIDRMEDLYVVDEAPFWSRDLIFATTWLGAGLSFTDGWTLALEYMLWHHFSINITRFVPKQKIFRAVHPDVDMDNNERWNGDRKTNFEYIRSWYFKALVLEQAHNLALRIKKDHMNKETR